MKEGGRRALLGERGQSTVEAAYLIPVLFLGLLLLVQPGILLYDRMVMHAAAAEGCRLLATKTDALGSSQEACENFIRHRLASVPPEDHFHMHDGGCSWDIRLEGSDASPAVSVTVGNRVKLLPLIGGAGALLGAADGAGVCRLEVSVSLPTQPTWVDGAEAGRDPAAWIGAWLP